jgi:hypothetical protein
MGASSLREEKYFTAARTFLRASQKDCIRRGAESIH